MTVLICDTRSKKNEFVQNCIKNKYSKILIVGQGGTGKSYSVNKLREALGSKVMSYYFDDTTNLYEPLENTSHEIQVYIDWVVDEKEYAKYDIVGMYIGDESRRV